MDMVDTIERETVGQAPSWFQYRKGRLTTATMNNQIKMKCPKIDEGFMSAAEGLLKGLPKNNKELQLKLSHGRFYSRYEQHMKNINRDTQVEKSCFVVD